MFYYRYFSLKNNTIISFCQSTNWTMETTQWSTLFEHLKLNGRTIVNAPGDGFCLLHSVTICMQSDFGVSISLEELKSRLMQNLIQRGEEYISFHLVSNNIHPQGSSLDDMMNKLINYLDTGRYNQTVVDIVPKMLADCLNATVIIYQNNNGLLEKCILGNQDTNTKLHLKYSTFHYDAIVKTPKVHTSAFHQLQYPGKHIIIQKSCTLWYWKMIGTILILFQFSKHPVINSSHHKITQFTIPYFLQ